MLAEVDQNYLNLAAIVSVDGARRIDQGETFFERPAAARPHLAFEAWRYFEGDSGRHGGTCERGQHKWLIDGGEQIQPGGVLAVIARGSSTQASKLDDRDYHQMSGTSPSVGG
jgi:hypothetical protein